MQDIYKIYSKDIQNNDAYIKTYKQNVHEIY